MVLAALTLWVSTVELGLDTLTVRLRTGPLIWAGNKQLSQKLGGAPSPAEYCLGTRTLAWSSCAPPSWALSSFTHLAWLHPPLP